jgi:hypothetical protein
MIDTEDLFKKMFNILLPLGMGLGSAVFVIYFWWAALNPPEGESGLDGSGFLILLTCSIFPISMFILLGYAIYSMRKKVKAGSMENSSEAQNDPFK